MSSWASKYGWKEQATGDVFISNQEESIKTKNITEKITFDSAYYRTTFMFFMCSVLMELSVYFLGVAGIMASNANVAHR